MKLVGSDETGFIRIPFMLEGTRPGLLGAMVAVVIVLALEHRVNYLVGHYHVQVLSLFGPAGGVT